MKKKAGLVEVYIRGANEERSSFLTTWAIDDAETLVSTVSSYRILGADGSEGDVSVQLTWDEVGSAHLQLVVAP